MFQGLGLEMLYIVCVNILSARAQSRVLSCLQRRVVNTAFRSGGK